MPLLQDTSSLDLAHAYRLHRLSRLLRQHLQRTLAELLPGLSPEQYFVLFRLHELSPCPQKALVDRTLDDRPNITRIVSGLVDRGLVERQRDPEDGRGVLLSLTPEGRARFGAALPGVVETREGLFGDMDKATLAGLEQALDHLEQRLEALLR